MILLCIPSISASDPICEVLLGNKKVNNSGVCDVINNDTVNMFCQIWFWGSWVPTMRWQIHGEQVRDTETMTYHDDNLVTSNLTLVIDSHRFSLSTFQLSCLTSFILENKPEGKTASNHSWLLPYMDIASIDYKSRSVEMFEEPL